MDLNHRPPGPEPGALARLRYAPTDNLGRKPPAQGDYQINTALRLGATSSLSLSDCARTTELKRESTSAPRECVPGDIFAGQNNAAWKLKLPAAVAV